MTPEEIRLVRESFAQIVPIRDTTAGLFYAQLFQIDPETAALFSHSDFMRQGGKLMEALALVVRGLDDLDTMLPAARALGCRHVDYGVVDSHYASVGEALSWALRTSLAARFTPEVERSWSAAYALLSSVMMDAAHERQDAAASVARG